jgi:hypothetical protein
MKLTKFNNISTSTLQNFFNLITIPLTAAIVLNFFGNSLNQQIELTFPLSKFSYKYSTNKTPSNISYSRFNEISHEFKDFIEKDKKLIASLGFPEDLVNISIHLRSIGDTTNNSYYLDSKHIEISLKSILQKESVIPDFASIFSNNEQLTSFIFFMNLDMH